MMACMLDRRRRHNGSELLHLVITFRDYETTSRIKFIKIIVVSTELANRNKVLINETKRNKDVIKTAGKLGCASRGDEEYRVVTNNNGRRDRRTQGGNEGERVSAAEVMCEVAPESKIQSCCRDDRVSNMVLNGDAGA